jgi:hypothetical protein
MISILMLIASAVAMTQFGVSYWRSLIAGMAAKPLSEAFVAASGLETAAPSAGDFGALLTLHKLTPGLESRPGSLRGLQAYYSVVNALKSLPALNRWAQSELNTCAKYLAVVVDQRMSQNLACAAEMRSC